MSVFCRVAVRFLSSECQLFVVCIICIHLTLWPNFISSMPVMPIKHKNSIIVLITVLLLIAVVYVIYQMRLQALENKIIQHQP